MNHVFVIAENNDQLMRFRSMLQASGELVQVRQLRNYNWRGFKTKRIVVLPKGWNSLIDGEAERLRVHCAKHSIELFNVTATKLRNWQAYIDMEKKNNASSNRTEGNPDW